MKRDPNESENLAAQNPEKVSELRLELVAWLKHQSHPDQADEASPEEIELLRSLGYIE